MFSGRKNENDNYNYSLQYQLQNIDNVILVQPHNAADQARIILELQATCHFPHDLFVDAIAKPKLTDFCAHTERMVEFFNPPSTPLVRLWWQATLWARA